MSGNIFMYVFFFFSSRRRHTRFDCDWSSDVCSSDLIIFDIETVFLIPWGTIYFGGATGSTGGPSMGFLLVEMLVFMFILRSEEHTSELQSQSNLVCRLLLEKKKTII